MGDRAASGTFQHSLMTIHTVRKFVTNSTRNVLHALQFALIIIAFLNSRRHRGRLRPLCLPLSIERIDLIPNHQLKAMKSIFELRDKSIALEFRGLYQIVMLVALYHPEEIVILQNQVARI